MDLNVLNDILTRLEQDREHGRDHILELSVALIEWMGFSYAENGKPRLLDFQTIKLKDALAPAPITGQEQLYRLTAEGQSIRIRFAVLKKYDKRIIHYLVDNNVGLSSFQASMRGIKQVAGREPFIAQQPYFLHFITTAKYDRLWVVFNEGEQKRVLIFRRRLSQTQFNKILPAWKNIAEKPKAEIAKLFWSSLDIKEVNKEFYKQIKTQFDALVGIAKAQIGNVEENTLKQFAVRLIGRYIFCWFLKEKEVIPEQLLSSKTIEKYKDIYFQKYLVKLFFKTLNIEVTDPSRNDIKTELDELYKNIPYLNGGLFDWHQDEDILFEKLDLNSWLIVFVKVLEDFDFTVDESSSQYQMVSIDPEMLGRIFENLLASQNPETEKMANQRKAFGAFYTPREIVDYMVNESLKAYVETQLYPAEPKASSGANEPVIEYKGTLFQVMEPQQTMIPLNIGKNSDSDRHREQLKIKIDKLFSPDCIENPFPKEETVQLRKALGEITVLDPACGSGAFPMGVMLRLMELRQIIGHGYRNNYDLKEEILSRNIFGVDIMPMAVEIARLRAWLSLVLEADYKPSDRKNNFGIAALPNLDFKFVCANSLISNGFDEFVNKLDTSKAYFSEYFELQRQILVLEKLRDLYFDPKGDKSKKIEIVNQFNTIKKDIKTWYSNLPPGKKKYLGDFFDKSTDWNPFNDSHPSIFFSPAWMFGIKTGFDVVIGNPPYVSANNMKFKDRVFFNQYKYYTTLKGKWDLYVAFTERSLKLLKPLGAFTFIVPFGLLNQPFAQNIRAYILNDYKLLSIVDLHNNKIFENATVPSCIPLIKKEKSKNHSIQILDFTNDRFVKIHVIGIEKYKTAAQQMFRTEDLDHKTEVLNKIKNKGEPLETYFYCSTGAEIHGKESRAEDGVLTSGKSKFDVLFDKYELGLVPYIEGADIKKSTDGRYSRPQIKKWLDYSQTENMRSPKFKELFESEKLILRRSSGLLRLLAIFDDRRIYTSEKCILIISKSNLPKNQVHFHNNDLIELKYLLALLNSKMMDFYYESVYGGFIDVYPNNLKELPIFNPPKKSQKLFVSKVENILKLRKEENITENQEKELDILVYKLYDLTYDEVKVIDKDFWLSEEEYRKVKID